MTVTDLVPRTSPGSDVVVAGADQLVQWARAASAAHELGTALCQTAFVPEVFRNKPGETTAAILYGAEVGLSPIASLRGVYVIGGQPSTYARTMMAIVLGAGHEVWTEELTDAKAVVCGRRRASQQVEKSTWTIERARRAGYTRNKKYETDPQAMLLARAQSDICRRVAADALMGLAYSVEELEDEQQPTRAVTREVAAPASTTRQRKSTAAPAPKEPPLKAEAPAEPEPQPEATEIPPEPITKAQLTKLHVLLQEAAFTDRELALEFYADTTGRPVESSKDLTKEEASAIIERLVALGAAPADEHPADEAAIEQEPVEDGEQATLDGEAQQ